MATSDHQETQIHGEICFAKHVERLVAHQRHRESKADQSRLEAVAKKFNWKLSWVDKAYGKKRGKGEDPWQYHTQKKAKVYSANNKIYDIGVLVYIYLCVCACACVGVCRHSALKPWPTSRSASPCLSGRWSNVLRRAGKDREGRPREVCRRDHYEVHEGM